MKGQRIYDGILEFDSRRHAYTFNGTPVPGCTTILRRIGKGDTLIQWAASQAAEHVLASFEEGMSRSDIVRICGDAKMAWNTARKEAADIGANVHAYAEAVLLGETPPKLLTPEAEAGASAFESWLREHMVRPVAVERRVFSKAHFFAGTTDLVCHIGKRLSVVDFKTSSGIYPEYALQLAAYRLAYCEEQGFEPNEDAPVDRWVIRVDKKTGAFESRQYRRHLLHQRAFLEVLALHRSLQDMEATEETAPPTRTRKKKAA